MTSGNAPSNLSKQGWCENALKDVTSYKFTTYLPPHLHRMGVTLFAGHGIERSPLLTGEWPQNL